MLWLYPQANYEQQIKQLIKQIQALELQKQIQVHDINQLNQQEKVQLETINKQKMDLLHTSLTSLQEQKLQKEQIAEDYMQQLRLLQYKLDNSNARPVNWTLIIACVLVGLILGASLF